MNIILLSGGSGKRLWPLSNNARAKQFLKLLKDPQNNYESMLQRVMRQIKETVLDANIVIATGVSQVETIKAQLGDNADIVIEPECRDTFPAILLSASYLFYKKNVDADAPVIVLPIDPYTELEYFYTLKKIEKAVEDNASDIILMGICPTYPSEKYGYILPSIINAKEGLFAPVKRFHEKPDLELAKKLVKEGAYWNGGVFGFRLEYVMKMVRQYIKADSFETICGMYHTFRKISFDYEIVEKAESVGMIPYKGIWKDLGTWNTLSEEMEESFMGHVVIGEGTENTTVINETQIPLVVLGSTNQIIAVGQDGILISDKQKSSNLKPYVENLDSMPKFEELGWGNYRVINCERYDESNSSLVKHILLHRGKCISEPANSAQSKIWIILNGAGEIAINDERSKIRRGDKVSILPGQWHELYAMTEMNVIEILLEIL